LYQNAAECYAKCGMAEEAARLLERCVEEFPRTPGLWLKLARLYITSASDVDLQKAQECLRKEEEIDPSFGENPLGSIALMLGELAATDLRATLRKVAESSPATFNS
jgi:tetratricopeptide (TPR) repeat protein